MNATKWWQYKRNQYHRHLKMNMKIYRSPIMYNHCLSHRHIPRRVRYYTGRFFPLPMACWWELQNSPFWFFVTYFCDSKLSSIYSAIYTKQLLYIFFFTSLCYTVVGVKMSGPRFFQYPSRTRTELSPKLSPTQTHRFRAGLGPSTNYPKFFWKFKKCKN